MMTGLFERGKSEIQLRGHRDKSNYSNNAKNGSCRCGHVNISAEKYATKKAARE